MPSAMIPLAIPDVSGREADYLRQCIDTNFVSSVGPFVTRFEEMVAATDGAPAGVATASGTSGLHVALVALGVGRDDLVILPSFTFIASANAIAHCGAAPWLFDVDPDTWTLDPRQVNDALRTMTRREGDRLLESATGRRVAAIMTVQTLGIASDLDALGAAARAHDLPLVVDAAAAIGSTYRGRGLATCADLVCYSFNGNKTVTAGGGGMVTGPDVARLDRIRHLTTQARVSPAYEHDAVGFNYRMTNLQAAVGCAQMERLAAFLDAKRRIRDRYDRAFDDLPGVRSFPRPETSDHAFWLSGILLDGPDHPSVASVCGRLRDRGIDARPFWMPVHLQQPYADAPRVEMDVCTDLWPRIVTLPCSTSLTDEEQDVVIDAVRDVLGD
jgi:dTDP-4-amino-4,6-dideoxygalactose transaminase